MHILTYDEDQNDAPRLCDSESARMMMPNRVEHEIFGKQFFGASDKKPKNQTILEKISQIQKYS
jgi:hypothetical protein